jgi:hypothetical protein
MMMVGSKFGKWYGAQILEWFEIVHLSFLYNSNTLEGLIVLISRECDWKKCLEYH